METRQFNQNFKRLAQQFIKFDKPYLQKIDPDSEFGKHLVAIVAADTLMRELTSYQLDPSTTKHQRELAEIQYERLGNTLIAQSQSALDSSKSTRQSMTQKEYTAALKGVFDAMVPEHKQNLTQTQQERLQSVSAAINDHSYDINRSRGIGFQI